MGIVLTLVDDWSTSFRIAFAAFAVCLLVVLALARFVLGSDDP